MILHFFYYGLPEFDMTLEDRPNDFETDFEKLPPLKMQIELSDSSLCLESFEPLELANFRKQMAELEIDLYSHNYKKERASSFSTIVAKS